MSSKICAINYIFPPIVWIFFIENIYLKLTSVLNRHSSHELRFITQYTCREKNISRVSLEDRYGHVRKREGEREKMTRFIDRKDLSCQSCVPRHARRDLFERHRTSDLNRITRVHYYAPKRYILSLRGAPPRRCIETQKVTGFRVTQSRRHSSIRGTWSSFEPSREHPEC